MKVGIYDLSLTEREKIAKFLKDAEGIEAELKHTSINDEEENKEHEVVCIFVHSKMNKETIDKFPKLKAIITMSTGFDHIDLNYCKEKGIAVYNIPDYGTETVAEFTLLLMLAVLRRFNLILEDMKCSLCIEPEHLKGRELGEKTVGIVGTGRIGSAVIRLLKGFNVKILAYNEHEKEELKKQGVEFVSFEELLKKSDIISFHLPLTDKTYHILNEEAIKLIRPGSVIINTARGQLIDSNALVKRIDLLYVGLDVVEGEKLAIKEEAIIRKQPDKEEFMKAFFIDFLTKHPRAIVTPHIAYNTEEGEMRRMKKTVETIQDIKAGKFERYNRVA